jgi:L-alanine-DL-glutamate epimerase-like enolase superfamily enzyme
MNRRQWIKAAGAAAGSVALPFDAFARRAGARMGGGPASIETEIVRLNLKHTWTTTMSSSEYRDVTYARYTRDGVTGVGEGAPIVRYREDAKSAQAAIEKVRNLVLAADPWHYEKVMAQVFARVPGEHAGKAALDIALLDWVTTRLGIPMYRLFGLDPADAAVTTMSVGVDTPEMTRQKVEEAVDFPVLKIKMGIGKDEATLEAIRTVTNKPLRVDANEGWKTKEEAVEKINWLEKNGVEFVEQPLRADMIEETKWVRGRVHLPIIADEACTEAAVIPKLAEAYDGLNVKLDKAGGVLEAHRWISIAKALGMKTMLGCMVSSSVSVTAAAHLSPLVDYADLDGNLLIANDPYRGVQVKNGKLILPGGAGLGVTKRVATTG